MTGSPAATDAALSLAALEAFDPHPAGGGDERRFCCPLPGCREKAVGRAHQSLCANVASGLWTCNRCGGRGKLTERWDARPVQQIRRAQARARFALPPERQPGAAESAAALPGLLARGRPLAGTPGHRYLFGRDIGLSLATRAGVRWVPDCYGRPGLAFPMRDPAGAVVALNVRHTDGRDDPKTHTVGDRSLGVFPTAAAWESDPLVIAEGPFDALALATCEVPAVALVGTRAPGWLRRAAYARRVLVALDADAEGDKHAAALIPELGSFARSVARLRPPWGKDWNDSLREDYLGLREWLRGAIG